MEFRTTRWSLLVPPVGSGSSGVVSCGPPGASGGLREVGRALWALIKEMDTSFLDEFTLLSGKAPGEPGLLLNSWYLVKYSYYKLHS